MNQALSLLRHDSPVRCHFDRGDFGSNRAPRPRAWVALPAAVLLSLISPAVHGQELYVLWGGQSTPELGENTYSYGFEYLHNLSEHWVASFTWLNEGHVTNHHRDGHSLQLWWRWLTPERQFTFAAGVGPYRYYDTTIPEGQTESTDAHGWGVLASAAAHWYFRYPWALELRYNYAHTTTSITTHTYEIGFGYQFDPSSHPGPVVPPAVYGFASPYRSEITVVVGQSIHNNFQSPTGVAVALEYRYRLTPYIDATGALLDEGEAGDVKRRGVAGQVWLMREFLDQQGFVGLGFGPYFAHDSGDEGAVESGSRTAVLGLFSMTAGYRWSERWSVRGYWYRTLTTNGRDTDVIVFGLGVGYRF